MRGKHAAWKWFRFRSKEIRMSKDGEEADPTSLEDGIYDTSSEYTSEDEAGTSKSFDYTLSYDNSASFSVTTPESADIEVPNPLSASSNSCYETSSELEQNGSSTKCAEEEIKLTPRKKDKTDSAKQTRLDGGLGLLAL
ncbi:hypothetical protein ACHAXH_005222 [Discostella pseudostelligera]